MLSELSVHRVRRRGADQPTRRPHADGPHRTTERVSSCPGGMVEEGESPAVAAEREVREEVGLDVRVTRLLAVQHKAADDRAPERYLFDFACEPLQPRPRCCGSRPTRSPRSSG